MFFYDEENNETDPGDLVDPPEVPNTPAPTVNLLEDTSKFTYFGYSNQQTITPPTGNLYFETLEGKRVIRVKQQHQLFLDPEIWDFDLYVVFNQPAEVRSVLIREVVGQFTPGRSYHYDIDHFTVSHHDNNNNYQTDLYQIGGGSFNNISSPYLFALPSPVVSDTWWICLRSRNVSGQVSLYGTFDI